MGEQLVRAGAAVAPVATGQQHVISYLFVADHALQLLLQCACVLILRQHRACGATGDKCAKLLHIKARGINMYML